MSDERTSKERSCPHPTLYARDMFNQPQPWGGCLLCERDSWKHEAIQKAAEIERLQRELAEAEAELERRQAPEGPNVAGASSTKIACSCGQPHCHECGEDPAIVGYERTAVETKDAPPPRFPNFGDGH